VQISWSHRLRFLVCLIHHLPLLGYEHPITFNWYQSRDSYLWQIKPIPLAICVYRLIGSVRLHRLVSYLVREGMDSLGPPPRFDGTGFQWWKILIESHLLAKGLNVWRVTCEGMKNNGHQGKQFDAIAKCVILSALEDNVFNRVFSCKNAKDLWMAIKENHEGTKGCCQWKISCSHW